MQAFHNSSEFLHQLSETCINESIKSGANAAICRVDESISSGIEIRSKTVDNFELSHEQSIMLTVFCGKKRGTVNVTGFDISNIKNISERAVTIAKYTEDDDANGILEKEFLAKKHTHDLELYHSSYTENSRLINLLIDAEIHAESHGLKSDGVSFSNNIHQSSLATSNGFNEYSLSSYFDKSICLIDLNSMQTDYWHTGARNYDDMLDNMQLVNTAVNRVLRRRNKTELQTNCNVIFESNIATSLISALLNALSGQSLYRKLSFLNDSIGQKVLPEWINIVDDPFLVRGVSSCYFDNEGAAVNKRNIIENGIVSGYFLSAYTSRKMNLQTTGNSGGCHNTVVSSNFNGGIKELASEAQNAIIIIETIGHGLNSITGDLSVGASALVVKNGVIEGFVNQLTIAVNLLELYKNIIYIGNDIEKYTSIACGSIMVDKSIVQVST